ncbi:flavin-containing monooxygenase [Microbacterium aerolatum]|uniref:flavin-containing monooxygenase n=1 Tax=Microbacterium aerolatum TaxID=153731 RepID=UPI00384FBD34
MITDRVLSNETVERHRVVIVGSGFSGVGMAIKLKQQGEDSFVVLERESAVGGTWRDNTYPGAACDIQSHLYSFSFMPNPKWSRVYAPQGEILDYIQDCARKGGIMPHMRFDSELLSAEWDESRRVWRISTSSGEYESQVLISAAGHLSDPKYPAIDGIEEFSGTMFHSARWNHDAQLEGKRIGVLGTGASAIQIVPEMAKVAGQLTVFQRSAPYVVPRMDREYTGAEKSMFERLPETAKDLRRELFWSNEARFPQRRGIETFIDKVTSLALGHLEEQVRDEELRAKLTPDYSIGCKRILISNVYFPTYLRDNVELETTGIDRIDGNRVVLRDGKSHELDVLIVSTGFEASDLPISYLIRGASGQLLSDHWAGGEQAYACSTVNGFPNLFIMNGPNSGLGAGSIIFVIECQINYILGALREMRERESNRIEVSREAEQEFVEMVNRKAQGTVWIDGGCKSWYVDQRNGRLTTIWPDFMSHFRQLNGVFNPDAYAFENEHELVGTAR